MLQEIDIDSKQVGLEMTNTNSHSNLTSLQDKKSCYLSPRFFSNNDNSQPEQDPTHYIFTWKYYIIKLIFHISFHITLLSTLEPLFFFKYAVPMERTMFYDQLGDFTKYQHQVFESHDSQNIRNQPFYTAFIQFLQYEGASTDPTLIEMGNNAEKAENENEKYNGELELMGYMFPIYCGSFTLTYYLVVQYLYNYKNFGIQVLGEHIALMIFVAAYELWFFTNVILKYHPFTTEQVMDFMMNCLLVRLYDYYPEMRVIEHNETAICEAD